MAAAQARVRAVDLVAGHPGCRDSGVQRGGDHRAGQCGFGGETPLVRRDSGVVAPLRVVGPASGRYKARSIRACPRRRRVGQIHRDLGVLDPPGGAGVLALHSDRVTPFFTSPVSSTYADVGIG